MKHLSILGSTGSIGRQTISVVESFPEQFKVLALAAGGNIDELVSQIERHQPELVSVADARRADELAARLREKTIARKPAIHHGAEGMLAVATHPQAEIVVSAAVGVVGLAATYEAIKLGRTIALSNKEVLVAAGELVMAARQKIRNSASPGGQRAQRGSSVPAGRLGNGSSPLGPYRFRWPVPQNPTCRARERHDRAGARSSELAE